MNHVLRESSRIASFLIRLVRANFPKAIVIGASLIVANALNTAHASEVVIADKQDGKFHAAVSPQRPDQYANGGQYSRAFFKDVDLEITWWWLFREPVYYHNLKWRLDDTVSVRIYPNLPTYLKRSALTKYPDLLARYNALKPHYMEMTVDVTLQALAPIKKIAGYGTFFEYGEFKFTKTIRDIELMIAASGKNGENLSPGTPPGGFIEFASYSVIPGSGLGSGMTQEQVEKTLAATFINTGSVAFSDPKITQLRLPDKEIKSIYDEFMHRENGCREFTDNPVSWTCAEKGKSLTEWFKDIFKDQTVEEEQANKSAANDDFWDGSDDNKSSSLSAESPESSPDDFWQGGASEPAESIEFPKARPEGFWSGSAQSSDSGEGSFWDAASAEVASTGFKISKSGNKQGVVSSDGNTLIPFREWTVLSYKEGIAEVSLSAAAVSGGCVPRMRYTAYHYGWAWILRPALVGYVDKSGDWLTPPSKVFNATTSRKIDGLVLLSRDRNSMTENEKRRADRAEEKFEGQLDDCEDDMRRELKRATREFERNGYRHE